MYLNVTVVTTTITSYNTYLCSFIENDSKCILYHYFVLINFSSFICMSLLLKIYIYAL